MKKLSDYPEYREAEAVVTRVRVKLDELRLKKSEIEGKLNDRQRADRQSAVEAQAAAILETGNLDPAGPKDEELRSDLHDIKQQIEVNEAAARLGDQKLRRIRSQVSAIVSAEVADEARSLAVTIARTAAEYGRAIAAEREFFDRYSDAGFQLGSARVSPEGGFDLRDSSSIPNHLIRECIAAGYLDAKADWVVGCDYTGKLREAAERRREWLVASRQR